MYLNEPNLQIEEVDHIQIPGDFRLAGWVYILSNECMPGIYKVGMTTNSPFARAKEISSATGVPVPFKVEASFHSDSPAETEGKIHNALRGERVNDSREFFRISLSQLKDVCREYCQASTDETVAEMAMQYDFISFESLDELNVSALFDEIGINTFGSKLAIAERLIRLSVEKFTTEHIYNNRSVVFIDDEIHIIRNLEAQHVEGAIEE